MRTIVATQNFKSRDPGVEFKRVSIETPNGGDIQKNKDYLRLCLRESVMSSQESPVSFIMMYSQSLNDDDDIERNAIIRSAAAWQDKVEKKVFCIDRGLSNNMILTYLDALRRGMQVELRTLCEDPAIIELVKSCNTSALSAPDLDKLSKKLNQRKTSFLCNEQEPGDATNFRQSKHVQIGILKGISGQTLSDQHYYERMILRDSIMKHSEAPISFELLYGQVLLNQEINKVGFKQLTWMSEADKVVLYTTTMSNGRHDDISKSPNLRVLDINRFSYELKTIKALNEPTPIEKYSFRQPNMA